MTEAPEFIVSARSPDECDAERLATFQALVLEGGEVNPVTLPNLIRQARTLAFVQLNQSVVGIGGIKRPNESHRGKVFSRSKTNLNPAMFDFELGWVYIRPIARNKHQVSPLIRELLTGLKGAPIYATSNVNNASMHTSLKNCGFTPDGNPYPSKLNESYIQLFVRK